MRALLLGIVFICFSFIQFLNKEKKDVTEIKFEDSSIIGFYDYQSKLTELSDSLNILNLDVNQIKQLNASFKKLKLNESTINEKYLNVISSLKSKVKNLTGEICFTYNGVMYDGIVVDLSKESIQMHWKTANNNPFKSLGSVKEQLQKNGSEISMLANGGMYLQNNIPQGLYIENGEMMRPIDTDTNKFGNFYMQPNGVFFVTAKGASILSTKEYLSQINNKNILFATQSGPMLVSSGKINNHFKHKSSNYNIRSGVGKMQNGRIVFVISSSNKTNFHDFASIFKDVFGCNESLYLDGAISKMYLKELRPKDLAGDYGVIISVCQN